VDARGRLARLVVLVAVTLRRALAALLLAPTLAIAEPSVVPPEPIETPEISWPEGAVADSALVEVEVQVVIGETGEVREVKLVNGAGEPFDSAVIEGLSCFRFTPALMDGQPIAVAVPYVHRFLAPPPPRDEGPERDAVLEGLVQERGTRAPVRGLVVYAITNGLETVVETDEQGRFKLELPSGESEVRLVHPRYKRFLRREQLAPNEALKIRYLVDRASYDPFETTVTAARDRTEISRTQLSGRELTRIPGTFGDPFRVVTVLPGVTTAMSLLPYPIVRGSSPGNTGALLDGVRLPLLFHLLAGPAVLHPEFIERVDFFPGGFPVRGSRLGTRRVMPSRMPPV
jgi:TonB family protein